MDQGTALVVVAIIVFAGPLAVSWQNNRRADKLEARRLAQVEKDRVQAAKDRREDQRRQDEVAKHAAEAVDAQREATEEVAGARKQLGGQLLDLSAGQAIIHTLVNSNLTESMTATLAALRQGLLSQLEIVRRDKVAGAEPSAELLAAITANELAIVDLETKLADRGRQQVQVEQQQKKRVEQAPDPPPA